MYLTQRLTELYLLFLIRLGGWGINSHLEVFADGRHTERDGLLLIVIPEKKLEVNLSIKDNISEFTCWSNKFKTVFYNIDDCLDYIKNHKED